MAFLIPFHTAVVVLLMLFHTFVRADFTALIGVMTAVLILLATVTTADLIAFHAFDVAVLMDAHTPESHDFRALKPAMTFSLI